MSRILHLLNMSLRYGRSKGVREYRLEEPPLASLAAPCHLTESASHHMVTLVCATSCTLSTKLLLGRLVEQVLRNLNMFFEFLEHKYLSLIHI